MIPRLWTICITRMEFCAKRAKNTFFRFIQFVWSVSDWLQMHCLFRVFLDSCSSVRSLSLKVLKLSKTTIYSTNSVWFRKSLKLLMFYWYNERQNLFSLTFTDIFLVCVGVSQTFGWVYCSFGFLCVDKSNCADFRSDSDWTE